MIGWIRNVAFIYQELYMCIDINKTETYKNIIHYVKLT